MVILPPETETTPIVAGRGAAGPVKTVILPLPVLVPVLEPNWTGQVTGKFAGNALWSWAKV